MGGSCAEIAICTGATLRKLAMIDWLKKLNIFGRRGEEEEEGGGGVFWVKKGSTVKQLK